MHLHEVHVSSLVGLRESFCVFAHTAVRWFATVYVAHAWTAAATAPAKPRVQDGRPMNGRSAQRAVRSDRRGSRVSVPAGYRVRTLTVLRAVQTAGPQMKRSSVVGKNGGGAIDDVRTSYGMFVPRLRDDTFARIQQRIAAWSNTTVIQQEDMQARTPPALLPLIPPIHRPHCPAHSILLFQLILWISSAAWPPSSTPHHFCPVASTSDCPNVQLWSVEAPSEAP